MEDVLDGDDLGPMPRELRAKSRMQRREPGLDWFRFTELEHAAVQVPDARAARVLDDAESAEP